MLVVAYHSKGLEEKLQTYQTYSKVHVAILPPTNVLLFCQLGGGGQIKNKTTCTYSYVEEYCKKKQNTRGEIRNNGNKDKEASHRQFVTMFARNK